MLGKFRERRSGRERRKYNSRRSINIVQIPNEINPVIFYELIMAQIRYYMKLRGETIDTVADAINLDPSGLRRTLKLDSTKEVPRRLPVFRMFQICEYLQIHPCLLCLEDENDRQLWGTYWSLDQESRLDIAKFVWRLRSGQEKQS
jgi:hypothetical protein